MYIPQREDLGVCVPIRYYIRTARLVPSNVRKKNRTIILSGIRSLVPQAPKKMNV